MARIWPPPMPGPTAPPGGRTSTSHCQGHVSPAPRDSQGLRRQGQTPHVLHTQQGPRSQGSPAPRKGQVPDQAGWALTSPWLSTSAPKPWVSRYFGLWKGMRKSNKEGKNIIKCQPSTEVDGHGGQVWSGRMSRQVDTGNRLPNSSPSVVTLPGGWAWPLPTGTGKPY